MNRALSDPPNALDQRIQALQVEHAYRQLPISLLVNAVNGLILGVLLWGAIGGARLLLWLSILYSVSLLRLVLLHRYRDASNTDIQPVTTWGLRFTIGALGSGLAWGSAALLLFHPDSLIHQIFLAFALGGMVAGALPLLSTLPLAFPCFALPISLPIMIQLLLQAERLPITMATLYLVFTLAMLTSSAQFSRTFRESVELRLRLTSSIEARQREALLARIDALTGIANRRHFEEALDSEWKRAWRTHTQLALIMVDIDHFKRYNDHLGHVAGDVCLRRVAQTLASAARRPGDLVARIGGEEFAFLLPNTSLSDAATIAERVREDVLEERIAHPASPVTRHISISLGVAIAIPSELNAPANLIEAADAALYDAKHAGRNQVALAPEPFRS